MPKKNVSSVNIRPGVNILTILPHLNYQPWYALAEFVDNAIQSSLDQKKTLGKDPDYQLLVNIDFNSHENWITIKDNAGGIASEDFQRAFRPAEMPPNGMGLSEFGMGMKSAACWFSPNWSVRTSAIGENTEYTIDFDIDKIVDDKIEELSVFPKRVASELHYTEITLGNVRKFPKANTIQKIKNHLASIYRAFLQDGSMILNVNGEPLNFEQPKILKVPNFKSAEGSAILWKKNIDIDLGNNRSAKGFVALRETMSNKFAGFALFRRKRLIVGSFDQTYRPKDIFGTSSSHAYSRIFGEIHLRGFHVSHTKDGIQWDECEDDFLEKLREEISKDDMPLLQQAREYRSKKDVDKTKIDAEKAIRIIAGHLNNQTIPSPSDDAVEEAEDAEKALTPLTEERAKKVSFMANIHEQDWKITIEPSYEDYELKWLSIKDDSSPKDPEPREITVRIWMKHSFMVQFSNFDSEHFQALLGVAAAMSLAEVVAKGLTDRHYSSIRYLTDQILKNQLSRVPSDD